MFKPKTLIAPYLFYTISMVFDLVVTMLVYLKYPSLFYEIELNPITSFFIKNFGIPINLFIPFIFITLYLYITEDRYDFYSKNRKIYHTAFVICYCISLGIIHLYGGSGAFIYGWL